MKNSAFIFILILAACSSIKIKGVKKADGFSISNYKTFGFYEVSTSGDAIGPNYTDNLNLLKTSIAKHLQTKGLEMKTDQPDLMVNIGIAVNEKIQTRETSFKNPGDRTAYMGQRNYSWKSEEVEVGRYREGTVTLDFVERSSNKLVWQGSAESVLPEKQKNVVKTIEEGMSKLFAKL